MSRLLIEGKFFLILLRKPLEVAGVHPARSSDHPLHGGAEPDKTPFQSFGVFFAPGALLELLHDESERIRQFFARNGVAGEEVEERCPVPSDQIIDQKSERHGKVQYDGINHHGQREELDERHSRYRVERIEGHKESDEDECPGIRTAEYVEVCRCEIEHCAEDGDKDDVADCMPRIRKYHGGVG